MYTPRGILINQRFIQPIDLTNSESRAYNPHISNCMHTQPCAISDISELRLRDCNWEKRCAKVAFVSEPRHLDIRRIDLASKVEKD